MQTSSNDTKPMVMAARGLVGLLIVAIVASWLWGVVSRAGAAWGAGGPARADELLAGLAAAAALAGVVWLALGLALGLLALVPGSLGRAAVVVADVVTPRLLRRTAAFVLGVGVVAGLAPGASVATPADRPGVVAVADAAARAGAAARSDAVATGTADAVAGAAATALPDPGFRSLPDPGWSAAPGDALASDVSSPDPGWVPTAPTVRPQADVHVLSRAPRVSQAAPAEVVVRRGDSLWSIAARHLGPDASDAEIAEAWPAWFAANRDVVGDDPDLLLPGQVLSAPQVVSS